MQKLNNNNKSDCLLHQKEFILERVQSRTPKKRTTAHIKAIKANSMMEITVQHTWVR